MVDCFARRALVRADTWSADPPPERSNGPTEAPCSANWMRGIDGTSRRLAVTNHRGNCSCGKFLAA